MSLEELAKKVDENTKRLNENTKKINQNLDKIKDNSYALQILKDYKYEARKWFISFIIMTILFIIICLHHFIIK